MQFSKVIIKKGREEAILRRHPWVFSGAIHKIIGSPEDGDIVKIYNREDQYLGTGHYHQGSITVRIFDFTNQDIDEQFWYQKVWGAWKLRLDLGIAHAKQTNCFRWIHGEGDDLPGLIVDYYDGVVVFQAHSIGMHKNRMQIAQAIQNILGEKCKGVYDKSAGSLPPNYAKTIQETWLLGMNQNSAAQVMENHLLFEVNWETGQKTGFFLDQRTNRNLMFHYAKGKKVLNAFCYSGGFSVYALAAGAEKVVSIDVSAKAMDLTDRNVALNFPETTRHLSVTSDVLKFLPQDSESFDLIILDPPAFAKSMDKRHQAVQAYKRLNIEGLKKLNAGGILFTFSCSQVVDKNLFYHTITAAAIEAGRKVRVLEHLSQPGDHPVNMFHPEGSYLKGLLLYVE
jgi:23S rRNA (cytosine1962-C5)-methyltransferase